MARYPGTQFIVIDNSATTATVPIATKNPAAPTYLTTFTSVKGPEEIRTVSGQEFFDLYGSQDTILFSKYGQPLLQAAMNINTGAKLICKRAVLDSATLANATFGIEVSRELLANEYVIIEKTQSVNGGKPKFKSLTIKSQMLTYDKNENKWFVDSKKFPIIFRPVVYSINGTSYNDYPSAVNTIINDIVNNTNGKLVVNTTAHTTTFEKGILNDIINPTLVSYSELPTPSKEGETLLPHGFINDILQSITTPKFDVNNHKRISIDEIIEKLGEDCVDCVYDNDNDISKLSQIKITDPSDFNTFRTILTEYFITSKVYPLSKIVNNG